MMLIMLLTDLLLAAMAEIVDMLDMEISYGGGCGDNVRWSGGTLAGDAQVAGAHVEARQLP